MCFQHMMITSVVTPNQEYWLGGCSLDTQISTLRCQWITRDVYYLHNIKKQKRRTYFLSSVIYYTH
jgi:hypothetical protein